MTYSNPPAITAVEYKRAVISVRAASVDDVAEILPRTRALFAHEDLAISDELLESALRRLLGDASLGGVWLIEDGGVIGYAIVTFGYDLEFGGRDSYLTEIWIDEERRGRGAGTAALDLLAGELRSRDVRALHLQVRPDNPARRLYERHGFTASPRVVMTRRLV
jgi:ribosomal protein S18 acetylase RimI-like enzyme